MSSRLPAGTHLTCGSCKDHSPFAPEAEPDRKGPPVRQARGSEKDGSRVRQAIAQEEVPDAEIVEDDPEDDRPPIRPVKHKPRPRRRRVEDTVPESARRKRITSPPVLTAIIVSAICVGLASAALIYFVLRDPTKPASGDLLAHVPTDAVILSGYDLEELAGNPAFRRAWKNGTPPDVLELDRAGLQGADLSRVVVARTVNNGNTCVVRFKTPPDPRKFLHSELPGKSYAQFTSLTGSYRFGYFADSSTLVLAECEAGGAGAAGKRAKIRWGRPDEDGGKGPRADLACFGPDIGRGLV